MSEFDYPNPVEEEAELKFEGDATGDALRDSASGGKIVRGSVLRGLGYAISTLATLAASVLLLRYLGVAQFGQFVTVMSIMSIAGGLAEAGLTAVGNQRMALLRSTAERREMNGNLLGIRLVLTPLISAIAVAFTLIANYPQEMVLGAVLAGIGWTFYAAASSLSIPLSVDLKNGAVTALDATRQVGATVTIAILTLLGAGILPFYAASIPGAVIAIALTPILAARGVIGWPRFNFDEWRELVISALPIALAAVIGVIYLRMLTILMYQFSTETETGLFGTSARIIEAVAGLPLLAFIVALPVLSALNNENIERMTAIFQGMIEVGLIFAWLIATIFFLGADPLIELIGGKSYAGAAEVLKIQGFSLIGTLVAIACMMVMIASERRRQIIYSNAAAMASVFVIGIPFVLLWSANGAAAAAVVGELALGLAYLFMIRRDKGLPQARLTHTWKPVVGCALGIGVASATGFEPILATVIGGLVFAAVIVATKAIPPEIAHSLLMRDISTDD